MILMAMKGVLNESPERHKALHLNVHANNTPYDVPDDDDQEGESDEEHHGDVEPRPGVGTKSIIKPSEGTPNGLTRRSIRANRLRVSEWHRGTPKDILLSGETPPDGVVPKDAPATVTEGYKTERYSEQCPRDLHRAK
ncbi:LOW QUALITY PROTEIN: hypothetical protein X943_002987 [Babesia divergens]|uniref:Uncharacterized protein n=1 Tax=Babesia divergens TaxID=32595 RepID=A0AAD9GIF3_BABDI|nr:LOW QUALITY PROTEIN: hypothetical protein X943_002987 [Babesia divergens]